MTRLLNDNAVHSPAETDDQPTPSARLAWLGGGLWLVAREVLMKRIIQALAFTAGAAFWMLKHSRQQSRYEELVATLSDLPRRAGWR